MPRSLISLITLTLTACVSAPSYQFLAGGQQVNQPGFSFVLPQEHKWMAIMRSTYQCAFGALGMPKNDTLIAGGSVYNIPAFASKEDFLNTVKQAHSKDPKTDRFADIHNTEQIYAERTETCVIYRSASKDFGVEARRGGEYSVFETIGMHCIHPEKPAVGVQIELSRKAPPATHYPNFEAEGLRLLQSVTFKSF